MFTVSGEARRPTVLILHGKAGIAPFAAYARYADDLADAGIDAWLFSYYSATDDEVMRSPGRERHIALYEARFRAWAKTVSEIAGFALAQKASSGRVGLLGFSNGGFLAVGTAAVDPRIAALVVFYGGIPGPMRDEITRLPPLLALHGDGDHIIPIGESRALVDRAKALEAKAELIVYPRADHGFDFDPNSHIANDARSHAIAFLRRQLGGD